MKYSDSTVIRFTSKMSCSKSQTMAWCLICKGNWMKGGRFQNHCGSKPEKRSICGTTCEAVMSTIINTFSTLSVTHTLHFQKNSLADIHIKGLDENILIYMTLFMMLYTTNDISTVKKAEKTFKNSRLLCLQVSKFSFTNNVAPACDHC